MLEKGVREIKNRVTKKALNNSFDFLSQYEILNFRNSYFEKFTVPYHVKIWLPKWPGITLVFLIFYEEWVFLSAYKKLAGE